MNYELTCQQCGKKFQSSRKGTKYCGNSCRVLASQKRKEKNETGKKTTISIDYSPTEHQKLLRVSKSTGISVEDMIKFRSLVSTGTIESKEKSIETLKKEITKLKAHLSFYTQKPLNGLFLPLTEKNKEEILFQVKELKILEDEPQATLEEKLIWLATNCIFIVDGDRLPWK